MKEILLKCIVFLPLLPLLIVICVMLFDMMKTLISIIRDNKKFIRNNKEGKPKKTKNDKNTSEREVLLKSDEKMYSIINRARVTLTEEEKSHILNYVKKAHSCNSISCFWFNRLSYITVFEGKKVFPHFCVGILVEKLDSPVTVKKGFTIRNSDKTNPAYIVSFVSYDFKEEFSGMSVLPLRLEEYVVTQDKYEQIINKFVFHNNEEYMYLDLQDGNCLLYNSDLITIMSTEKEV